MPSQNYGIIVKYNEKDIVFIINLVFLFITSIIVSSNIVIEFQKGVNWMNSNLSQIKDLTIDKFKRK